MMRSLFYVAAAATLSLSACADAVAPDAQPRASETAQAATLPIDRTFYAPRDSIYTTQLPTEYLDASPGWQVATRFIPDYDGRFAGYRFYKAPGETGSHRAKLYTTSGQLVHWIDFPAETPSGWQRVTFTTLVQGYAGEEYYITVNTNTKQAKTPAYFNNNGGIYRNWGSAHGGGYGQPIHAFPSNGSGSSFFVDVMYRPVLCSETITENCL